MKTIIIGYGQIGQSMQQLYDEDIEHSDVEENTITDSKVDVMHICFGYNAKFVVNVCNYIFKYKPELTIINSTVPVGTTEEITQITSAKVVHSPVIGVHPNLYEGIMTFKKIIGGETLAIELAKTHFNNINVKTIVFDNSRTSEAAKLWSTSYYGWNIAFNKQMNHFCEENDVNFDQAYTDWNNNYNEGYETLDMNHVRRPVLKYMKGKTGGHCIKSNYDILENIHNVDLAKIWNRMNNGEEK